MLLTQMNEITEPQVVDTQLSEFILSLYQQAMEKNLKNFQVWASERVAELVSYDSILWADAIFHDGVPPNLHNFFLKGDKFDECSIEEVMNDYLHTQVKLRITDEVGLALTKNIGATYCGRDVYGSDEGMRRSLIYKHFAKKYRQEHICATSVGNPRTSFISFISLYRADRNKPFSKRDKQIKAIISPHLAESYRIHLQVSALIQVPFTADKPLALVDEFGSVVFYTDAFPDSVNQIASQSFMHSKIHDSILLEKIREEADCYINKIKLCSRRIPSGLYLVVIHIEPIFQLLTDREREVVLLTTQGKPQKEVARLLGIEINTVNNHLRNIREKLGIQRINSLAIEDVAY